MGTLELKRDGVGQAGTIDSCCRDENQTSWSG